ncbi:uncharacterized protein LOC143198183 [Rhynchophorus ferrugineus]|uniref:Uncharacterized protein n=1 Tax=Rhynchophorus ferrugineus TaxID=354439 RepID=A0A834HYH0_RHYFE|nr:hypothetical protein GWI33_017225 [Rhynchophorus ferrugineus]
MAQGKLKVKTKLPANAKKSNKKGSAVTKRANAPIKRKKQSQQEAQKLKQIITKTVNKAVEEDIRAQAGKTQANLSKAQQAVANYHKHGNMSAT